MSTIEIGITKLSARSRNKLMGVAVASGLVAASLSGVEAPAANAWCVGISGINIGGGCTSTFGNFALGLGPSAVADSAGFITGAIAVGDAFAESAGFLTAAWAAGTGSSASANGIVNWAVAQGTNVAAIAGTLSTDFLNFAANFGSAAAPASSLVEADYGAVNIAANLGGAANAGGGGGSTDMTVFSGGLPNNLGYGDIALNLIGNRNDVEAYGLLNIAVNIGSIINNLLNQPNGSDSVVLAGDFAGNPSNLSLASNWQPPFITEACTTEPCGNTVTAAGTLAFASAIGLSKRTVTQTGAGITIKTPLNPVGAVIPVAAVDPASTATALTASDPQKNAALNSDSAGNVSTGSTSVRSARPALKSVGKRLTSSVQNVGNAVKGATGGPGAGAKAAAGSTNK
jgi:hypothetical protein